MKTASEPTSKIAIKTASKIAIKTASKTAAETAIEIAPNFYSIIAVFVSSLASFNVGIMKTSKIAGC